MRRSSAFRAIGALLVAAGLTLACSSDSADVGPRIPAAIILIPNHPRLPQGLTLQLTATVVDASGRAIDGKTVHYSSSDSATVTVSATGELHAIGPLGTAQVTADLDGLTTSVDVEITQRIVSLAVTPESLAINPGLTAFLQVSLKDFAGNDVYPVGVVTFTSHNTGLVTVSTGGFVEAGNATGNTTITVAVDSFHVDVPVRVTQIPASISTDPINVVLQPGGTQQLTVTVKDLAGLVIPSPALVFTSSAPAVFSVSSSGLVSALANGSGTVKVGVEQLEKQVGVFVGNAVPVALTHTTQVGTALYEADIGPAGQLVISAPDANHTVRGTLPGFTLPTTLATGGSPLGVAVNHAGTRAYVATSSELSVLDLVNNVPLPPILVQGGGMKVAVVVSSDDQRAYLGTNLYVYVIDLGSSQVIDSISVTNAFFLALHPSQPLLYAGEGAVREINLNTKTVTRTFIGGSLVKEVAVSPDGSEVYAADEGNGALLVFSSASGQLTQTVPVEFGGFGLAVSAHLIAVATGNGVAVFDRSSRVPITTIPLGGQPRRPAIAADEKTIVVPNEGGWVDYIQ